MLFTKLVRKWYLTGNKTTMFYGREEKISYVKKDHIEFRRNNKTFMKHVVFEICTKRCGPRMNFGS